MEIDANTAVADMYTSVSKEVMIYGILTNKILVGATVIGFSRSGDYMNKEYFDKKLKVFLIVDVVFDDIKEMVQNNAKNPNQFKSMFQQINRIGLNQILFVEDAMKHTDISRLGCLVG